MNALAYTPPDESPLTHDSEGQVKRAKVMPTIPLDVIYFGTIRGQWRLEGHLSKEVKEKVNLLFGLGRFKNETDPNVIAFHKAMPFYQGGSDTDIGWTLVEFWGNEDDILPAAEAFQKFTGVELRM